MIFRREWRHNGRRKESEGKSVKQAARNEQQGEKG